MTSILIGIGVGIAELRKLSPNEKLKIIEALWGDLAANDESFASPGGCGVAKIRLKTEVTVEGNDFWVLHDEEVPYTAKMNAKKSSKGEIFNG